MSTITLDIPDGWEVVVRPRGGLAPASVALATEEPSPTPARGSPVTPTPRGIRPRLKLAAHGSRFASTMVEIDGTLYELPACVATVLREIGRGAKEVRFRQETRRKIEAHLPWLLSALKPDASARVIARRHAYAVADGAAALVDLVDG